MGDIDQVMVMGWEWGEGYGLEWNRSEGSREVWVRG